MAEPNEEDFRQRLSALVGCSSPDGSAELGVIETLLEVNATLHAALAAALDEITGDSIGGVVDVLDSQGRAALAKAEGR
jgi:hypothetical protein